MKIIFSVIYTIGLIILLFQFGFATTTFEVVKYGFYILFTILIINSTKGQE